MEHPRPVPPQAREEDRMNDRKTAALWMVADRPATARAPSKSFWTRIGTATENEDGSWSIEVRIPTAGQVRMEPRAAPADEGED